jgi:LysM repeat protein
MNNAVMYSATSYTSFANRKSNTQAIMKPHTLPIKRKPVPKGILHKLSAVTRPRKQRVAAAAAPAGDMEADDGSSKISRALTIIFLIHIVAVGLIFVHKHFLDGRMPAATAAATQEAAAPAPVIAATPVRETLPRLSSGDKVYVVKPGDNYTRIAGREGVEESALRTANENVEIRPGLILSVPPRRIVAQEPAEVARIREAQQTALVEPTVDEEDGLVEAIDIAGAPRAVAVQQETSAIATATATAPATGGRTHTVKSGDNIWRISQQYKVKQDDLMKINNITDARKVRIGMKLVIPE